MLCLLSMNRRNLTPMIDLVHSPRSSMGAPQGQRNNIPIEKGVSLNEEFLMKNRKKIEETMEYFAAYPDRFLDLISTEGDGFHLFFYQRISRNSPLGS